MKPSRLPQVLAPIGSHPMHAYHHRFCCFFCVFVGVDFYAICFEFLFLSCFGEQLRTRLIQALCWDPPAIEDVTAIERGEGYIFVIETMQRCRCAPVFTTRGWIHNIMLLFLQSSKLNRM